MSSGGSRWRKWCTHFLGEVTGVGVSDDALCLVPQRELGVSKERLVGGGHQPTGHLQDGIGGSGLDTRSQFLGLGFPFGVERFGHDDLRPKEIPAVAQSYTELNIVPTNFPDAYPI